MKCGLDGISFSESVHYPVLLDGGELVTCNSIGQVIHPKNQIIPERQIEVAKIRHYTTKTVSEFLKQKFGIQDGDGYFFDRTLDNRFFVYCNKTKEKVDYFRKHKPNNMNITLISTFYDVGVNPRRREATKKAVACWMKQKHLPKEMLFIELGFNGKFTFSQDDFPSKVTYVRINGSDKNKYLF